MVCLRIICCAVAILSRMAFGTELTMFFKGVENVQLTARSPYRANATDEKTIHLYQGDVVEVVLCADQEVTLKLGVLRYSNDGGIDKIEIKRHNELVKTIMTEANSGGNGTFWDKFEETVLSDTSVKIDVGEHPLYFSVPMADCYGVELDMLTLTTDVAVDEAAFICGKSLIPATVPSLCAQPDVSTTTTTESTPATTPTTPSTASTTPLPPRTGPLIEQRSTVSQCLDDENVNIKFNPRKLVGLEISAYSYVADKINIPALTQPLPPGKACTDTVWKLGDWDMSNAEFSSTASLISPLDFTVASQLGEVATFPGQIIPAQTSEVIIRYTVPADILIKYGKVHFTLGLTNVNRDIVVGLQYYDRAKADAATTDYVVLKPDVQSVSWDLPARSVSPSLENQLHLYFDSTDTEPVTFDYLRLDAKTKLDRMRPKIIAKSKTFMVRGVVRTKKKSAAAKGMTVTINGKSKKNVERIRLSVRPYGTGRLNSVLTITEDGKLVPQHDTKKSVRGVRGFKGFVFTDLSGFIFGTGRRPIKTLSIDTNSQIIVIGYSDSSTLKLSYKYFARMTKIVLLESTISENSFRFVSSYLTDSLAATNVLTSTGTGPVDVRHIFGSVDGVESNEISFVKTLANPTFKSTKKITVVLPNDAI